MKMVCPQMKPLIKQVGVQEDLSTMCLGGVWVTGKIKGPSGCEGNWQMEGWGMSESSIFQNWHCPCLVFGDSSLLMS